MRQTQRSPEGPHHLHRIPRLSEAPCLQGLPACRAEEALWRRRRRRGHVPDPDPLLISQVQPLIPDFKSLHTCSEAPVILLLTKMGVAAGRSEGNS